MRVLHGQLKRMKNQDVIKETSLLPPHTVNAIELLSNKNVETLPPPHFYINLPFLAKFLLPP